MFKGEGLYIDKIASGGHYKILTTDAIAPMDLQFKIVIVGDSGCGKTSLFNSYIRGSFPREYEPTIFENHRSFVQRENGDIISADLWDTAGQEEYERLRRLSYQDADLVIIAYNINSSDSLSNIPDVWAIETLTYSPGSLILLVGLKSDMEWNVNPLEAERVAREIGAIGHIQCSSLMGDNINGVFDCVFNAVYNRAKIISGKTQQTQLQNQNQNQNQNQTQKQQTGNKQSKIKQQEKKQNGKNKSKKNRRCVIL